MNRSFVCSLIAGLLLAIGTVSAQQSSPPAPTPGPEHARLKKMEGTWDAVMTEPDGKKTKGEMNYKMECGGLWLASDFKGEHMGKPFHGKGLDSYDPAKKKYVGVWVDSWITSPLHMEGTYDEKTRTATSTGECNGPDGKPMKMRMVSKTIDDDHETFEMYMTGPDGKETKGATIDYTRRKR
ncbi:MAG TPA: DUF1579 domain-containing protein [Pirellulaceae bacterium]|nr:DUF1579 domain-containing protein [Pirellulaceae bacterium]